MIISPGRGYIFVHIPKTGGTSLAAALEARAMADDILIGDTEKAVKRRGRVRKLQHRAAGRLWKHATLRDISGVLPEADLNRLFVFCVVRNPWDRMVSYYHWLRAQSFAHPQVRLAQSETFTGFVTHPDTARVIVRNPYESYTEDVSGQRCGLFLRLEHLDEDLDKLAQHIGFRPDVAHLNASDRGPRYQDYYDAQTQEVVAHICAQEVARFGYRF
ncbi:sulfotransferase family 2 domain-containing protein [Sagittula sp. NFXS13]|uniref:sulfotransferase family 2 domain-containing protein n=1 Tax=Sagittula sp. NFXS13 TaxID=2819095 RepID=UPI0032DFEF1E